MSYSLQSTSYGPYGQPGGLPDSVAGIDDLDSLWLTGLSEADPGAGYGWYAELLPGRYILNNATDFTYQYARAQTVDFPVIPGLNSETIQLPSSYFTPTCFTESPTQVADTSGRNFIPIQNTIRWAVPVPPTNILQASGFVDNSFLYTVSGQTTTYGPAPTDLLWFFPTFGAQVIAVHRSRNPRSYDVLGDSDSILYEVSTPDQLTDDRCYCQDYLSGFVYGRVASQNLPAPPYGSGNPAQTYVTLAFPGDSDPYLNGLGLANVADGYWQGYFVKNAVFDLATQGVSGAVFYDPLRLEEVAVVDRDGLIRLRRTNVVGPHDYSGKYSPCVTFASPDGIIKCTTTIVSGNVVDAQIPDPTNGNALSLLEYGTTVVVKYYVKNSFTVSALTGGPVATSGQIFGYLHYLADNTVTGTVTGSFTYETDPRGSYKTAMVSGAADLNPFSSHVGNGFLYLEDPNHPASIPISTNGRLLIGVPRPLIGASGECFTVKAALTDSASIEITGAQQLLTFNPTNGCVILNESPSSAIAGADGYVNYRLQINTQSAVTLQLADTRASGTILATAQIEPIVISGIYSLPLTGYVLDQPWEPTINLSIGESYRSTAHSDSKLVRVSVLSPDGFPWNSRQVPAGSPATAQSCMLLLTSERSTFSDPGSQGLDIPIGPQVSVFYNGTSPLLSADGILTVGYSVVSGDTIRAYLYVGDDRYTSFSYRVD